MKKMTSIKITLIIISLLIDSLLISPLFKDYGYLRAEDYTLKTGDTIEVLVWEYKDLSRILTIRPDGKISFPLIDEIIAVGLTPKELDDIITQKLSSFFPQPKVTIIVQKFQYPQFSVIGQVNKSGVFTLDRDIKVLEAISWAGGFLPDADTRKALIFREKVGVVSLDLYSLLNLKKNENNILLKPNDILYIPNNKDNFVYMIGEVKNPGIYPLEDKLTLLKAIILAGNPKDSAMLPFTKVIRQTEKGIEIINVDLKDLALKPEHLNEVILQQGDIVYLPPTKLGKLNKILDQAMPLLMTIFYATGTTYNIKELYK
ncbi:polysaccharide export protein [bacterium]|nr:polysaccharide export protein [bacterium]